MNHVGVTLLRLLHCSMDDNGFRSSGFRYPAPFHNDLFAFEFGMRDTTGHFGVDNNSAAPNDSVRPENHVPQLECPPVQCEDVVSIHLLVVVEKGGGVWSLEYLWPNVTPLRITELSEAKKDGEEGGSVFGEA